MNWITWLIVVILIIAAIVILIKSLFRYFKKRLINKAIDKGADIITKTTGSILEEKTASHVNEITNITAQLLKSRKKLDMVKFVAKKGLEIAKKKENVKDYNKDE